MLRPLLWTRRALASVEPLVRWWHGVSFHWQVRERVALAPFVMLLLPVLVLGFLVRLTYLHHMELSAERQRRADLSCLAENVYFEARGEPSDGQRAVAEVTLNRVASPRFPSTVCEVVHEKRWDDIRERYLGAFSWTELDARRNPKGAEWERAVEIAAAVYEGVETPLVSGALFYHATHIRPSWARTKEPVASIGRHVFYE